MFRQAEPLVLHRTFYRLWREFSGFWAAQAQAAADVEALPEGAVVVRMLTD